MLKSLQLRTIFDLESVAIGQSTALKDAVCDMLWADGTRDKLLRAKTGLSQIPHLRLTGEAEIYSTVDRHLALSEMIGLMTDDLHVFRLRQLWELFEQKLRKDAATDS